MNWRTDKPTSTYMARWGTTANDGARIKHTVVRDPKKTEFVWHFAVRLTDCPDKISPYYKIHPRQFFGKVWLATRLELHRAATWKAIGDAVRMLEQKEKEE